MRVQQLINKSIQLKMAKEKSKQVKKPLIENELMHDYIHCEKCGGDMLPLKEVEDGKLYKCDDCKSTEISKVE